MTKHIVIVALAAMLAVAGALAVVGAQAPDDTPRVTFEVWYGDDAPVLEHVSATTLAVHHWDVDSQSWLVWYPNGEGLGTNTLTRLRAGVYRLTGGEFVGNSPEPRRFSNCTQVRILGLSNLDEARARQLGLYPNGDGDGDGIYCESSRPPLRTYEDACEALALWEIDWTSLDRNLPRSDDDFIDPFFDAIDRAAGSEGVNCEWWRERHGIRSPTSSRVPRILPPRPPSAPHAGARA